MNKTATGFAIGGGIGLTLLAVYVGKLKNAGDKIVLQTSPKVSKGVVSIEVLVQNPTKTSLKVSHPFVKLYKDKGSMDNNEPILSSQIESQQHTIQANSETSFRIRIGTITEIVMKLGFSALSILKDAFKNGLRSQTLYVKTELRVNERVPYATIDEFNIHDENNATQTKS